MASRMTEACILSWTEDNVAGWASYRGLNSVVVTFISTQGIDGEQLLKLTYEKLAAFMILRDATKLMDAVADLKGAFYYDLSLGSEHRSVGEAPAAAYDVATSDFDQGAAGFGRDGAGSAAAFTVVEHSRDNVLHFWRALSSAAFDEAKGTITLPIGAAWLGDPIFSQAMFVRPCYKDLHTLVLRPHRAIVLGTPGTGKTMFGLFVAWSHLICKPTLPLIYHSQAGLLVLVVRGYARFVEYRDVLHTLNTVDGAFYIVDACVPNPSVCKTLLISSPKKAVWSRWQRQNAAGVLYMPMYDMDELETCRRLCFSSVSLDRLLILYEKWGGSIRLTLAHDAATLQDVASAQLNSDLSEKDLSKMLEIVAAADFVGPQDASHYVIHIVPSSNYRTYSLQFASAYMCSRALMTSLRRDKNKVISFIQSSDNVQMLSSLRGQLYERFAIAALGAGGTFSLMELNCDHFSATLHVEMPKRDVCFFDKVDMERVCMSGRISVPQALNFLTWDAIVLEPDSSSRSGSIVTFFQMTVSSPSAHGLNAAGFSRADMLVKSQGAARFLWVCPKFPVNPLPVVIPDGSPTWANSMQQFVLVISSESMELVDEAVVNIATEESFAVDAEVHVAPAVGSIIDFEPMMTRGLKRRRA